MAEKELLDLEESFLELRKLPIAKYIVLSINPNLELFRKKIDSLNYPIWIKLNSNKHKVEIGGIEKACNFEELEKKHRKLQKKFPEKKFIVQENIEGIEIIAGIKQDKTFGKVLMLGRGGTHTEILRDVQFRVLPLTNEEIESAIKELQIQKILEKKKYNTNSLIKLIEKFSKLEIKEADLNPIMLNEKEAIIVDARISISEE